MPTGTANNKGQGRPETPHPQSQATMKVNVTENNAKNGIELRFDAKPCCATRSFLKSSGFRWSKRQKIWYARRNPATHAAVEELLHGVEEGAFDAAGSDLPRGDEELDPRYGHLASQVSHVVHFPSTGHTVYQNKRGRCEDAPCCGCCS